MSNHEVACVRAVRRPAIRADRRTARSEGADLGEVPGRAHSERILSAVVQTGRELPANQADIAFDVPGPAHLWRVTRRGCVTAVMTVVTAESPSKGGALGEPVTPGAPTEPASRNQRRRA